MGRFAPLWTTFNAGELSPLIDGRTDQDKYFAGCKKLQNFIPTVQGPVSRRGGTRYMGAAKDGPTAQTWLLPLSVSGSQEYMLAFSPLAIRFWVNRGQLLNLGVPFEVVTPYAAADLITTEGTFALRSAEDGDVMWVCHYAGSFQPRLLKRLAATNWTFNVDPFMNGPFQDVDPDTATTVTASASTGVGITLTASVAIFTAADIGTSFYLEQKDGAGVKTWQANATAIVGDVRKYEGNYYLCTATSVGPKPATGNNPPVHTEGRVWDGDGHLDSHDDYDGLGAEWEYRHSGYGWVRITAIGGGGTTATADVVLSNGRLELPPGATAGTTRWAHALFNATDGWPTAVTFYRKRLCYLRGRKLACSVTGAYDDFSRKDGPDVTEETAIIEDLAFDGGGVARWMQQNKKALLIGTDQSELAVREQTDTKVFAADNIKVDPQTEYGSRFLEPQRAGDALLFVTRSGRKLRELTIAPSSYDDYKADDLTVLSEHILDSGVVDMDFQQEPDNIVWCAMANGTMTGLTYNRERGVVAWVPHLIGGHTGTTSYAIVESVGCIPAPDGRRDDVWLSVRRQINGSTVRYIEYIEDNHLVDTDTTDGFYGDAGITYDGPPATVITGLGHLEGETIQILADGSAHAEKTVSGGQVTLNRTASKVQLGFDSPARLQTMRMDGGGQGTAQTLMKSIAEMWLRFVRTIGGKTGPSFDRLDSVPGLNPALPVGTPPPLFSGDRKVEFPAEYDTDGYVCVESSPMLPMTLVALIGRAEVND